jgi:cyanobactin maturation PatA/PatG family protease
LLDYLNANRWDASSVLWTLNFAFNTPVYAIVPDGPFARDVYRWLRRSLKEQLDNKIERVSISGRLGGQTRLFNGQVVPVIVPELRGMYSWPTDELIRKVCIGAAEPARNQQGVRDILERVYHELQNLGVASQDRAINYAATNATQLGNIVEEVCAKSDPLELDTITAEFSPYCRPGSDCWDVKVSFFNANRPMETLRKVFRFTVDVSDVVPVMVGPVRAWNAR